MRHPFDVCAVASLLLYIAAAVAQHLKLGVLVGPDLVALPKGSTEIPEGIYGVIIRGHEIPFCIVALLAIIIPVVWLIAFGFHRIAGQNKR